MSRRPTGSSELVAAQVQDARRTLASAEHEVKARHRPESNLSEAAGLVNTAGDGASNSEGLGILLDGVNALVDSLPALVKALDEVAKIHPFIAIAVGSFKVVIELEVKRRDNDKKVNILFLEMRNMMSALLQLQSVRTNHVGRDGMTVGRRLEGLVQQTATDIKECANACDTYSKKRLLVKVLKGPVWDERLKGYIQLFSDRKAAILFAVSIHTGMAVDSANDKLDVLLSRVECVLDFFEKSVPQGQRTLAEIVKQAGGAQMVLQHTDVMSDLLSLEKTYESALTGAVHNNGAIAIAGGQPTVVSRSAPRRSLQHQGFDYYRSAELRRARSRRAAGASGYYGPGRGSPDVVYGPDYGGSRQPPYGAVPRSYPVNDQASSPVVAPYYVSQTDPPYVYRHLYSSYARPESPTGALAAPVALAEELQLLNRELLDTPAVAIRKNFEAFDRKFEIQRREIVEDMRKIVVHEGDRVISSVLAGPHERIVDPDLYEIWKEMRWRGIVKARYLVLAIHDHFIQILYDQQHVIQADDASLRRISEDDIWTLEYIDLMHLQPIVEAFDDDISGFITIQEVNTFATSRPQGWSLLRWLAYWAIGWQISMTFYKRKIKTLLVSMQAVRDKVRLSNRWKVFRYIDVVHPLVEEMTRSFQEDADHLFLLPRFQAYVDREENRLRRSLETVKYDIDALDTLALVNGRRGIERNLFPMLYLLLSRHLDVMRLATSHIIHPDELVDAESSVYMVQDAFSHRRADVSALFMQRRLVVYQEIGEFACGMFSPTYGYVPPLLLSGKFEGGDDGALGADDNVDSLSLKLLKYDTHREDLFPECDDGLREAEDPEVIDGEASISILGRWSGILIFGNARDEDSKQASRVFSVHFHPSATNKGQFVASPLLYFPWMCTRTTFTGECTSDQDGNAVYTITVTFNASTLSVEYFRLSLSNDGGTLLGEFDRSPIFASSQRARVIMKKDISPEIIACYPTSTKILKNLARARWEYATSAVLYQVQRRNFSWRLLKARRDRRHRLASLLFHGSNPTRTHRAEEQDELTQMLNRIDPAELHFVGYAALEPDRFSWILPRCVGQKCGRLLSTTVPCVRCAVCSSGERYGKLGCTLCEDEQCWVTHVVRSHTPFSIHAIVKTRVVRWSAESFEGDLGRSLADREKAVREAFRARARGAEEDWYEGQGYELSPISGVMEDLVTTGLDGTSIDVGGIGAIGLPAAFWERKALSESEGFPLPLGRDLPFSGAYSFIPMGLNPKDVSSECWVGPRTESNEGSASVQKLPPVPPSPVCLGCGAGISLPCWICVDCDEEWIFVCNTCDKHGGVNAGAHKDVHTLLRVPLPQLDEESSAPGSPTTPPHPQQDSDDFLPIGSPKRRMADRLDGLEDRFKRFEGRFEVVEDQLARMERMLESLIRASSPSATI